MEVKQFTKSGQALLFQRRRTLIYTHQIAKHDVFSIESTYSYIWSETSLKLTIVGLTSGAVGESKSEARREPAFEVRFFTTNM